MHNMILYFYNIIALFFLLHVYCIHFGIVDSFPVLYVFVLL